MSKSLIPVSEPGITALGPVGLEEGLVDGLNEGLDVTEVVADGFGMIGNGLNSSESTKFS